MVAIVSGNGFGLLTGSAGVLGQSGTFGNPNLGKSKEAAYVNIANGNLVLRDQDEFLASLGHDQEVSRTYNSQATLNEGIGQNWHMGLVKQLTNLTGTVNTAGSTLTRIDSDGSRALYTYNASLQRYVTTDGGGGYDNIVYNSAAQDWTWTSDRRDLNGIYESYGTLASGGLIQTIREQGGALRLTNQYQAGKLSLTVNFSGDVTRFQYNNGNVSQVDVTTAQGVKSTSTYYKYDTQNRLKQVVTDLSPEDNSIADGRTYITTYTYDGTSNRVASIVQGDGTSLSFTYIAVNGVQKVASVTDGVGQQTTYSYDSATQTTVTDPLGNSSVFTYDAAGQLLSVKLPPVAGVTQLTQFAYDLKGNVQTVTDPRGKITAYEYDGNGNRIKETGPTGEIITRAYGAVNNLLLSETRWPEGASTTQKPSPPTLTTSYVYDAINRLRYVVSPEGRVQEIIWNNYSLRGTVIDYTSALLPAGTAMQEGTLTNWRTGLPNGKARANRTDYLYDARGQVTKTTVYAVPTEWEQTGNTAGWGPFSFPPSTRSEFVASGNSLAATSYNLANIYSVAHRAAEVPLGTSFSMEVVTPPILRPTMLSIGIDSGSWPGDGQRFRAVFDNGNLISQIQNGDHTKATYPWLGNIKANTTYVVEFTTQTSGAAVMLVFEKGQPRSSALTLKLDFPADAPIRLTAETSGGPYATGGTAADPNTTYVNNINAFDTGSTPTKPVVTQYVYDQHGQLLQSIDAASNVIAGYTYDGLGRQLTVSNALNGVSVTTYDDANNTVRLTLSNGLSTSTVYDAAGRAVATSQAGANGTLLARTTNAYDKAGRLRMSDAGNGQVTYFLYDVAGRQSASINANGNVTSYHYTANNQIARTIQYDQRVNVAQLRDASGNWRELAVSDLGLSMANSRSNWNMYDDAGLLSATVDATGTVTRFVYDKASRLTQTIVRAVPVSTAAWTAVNVLTSVADSASADDQVTRNYYDKNGKLRAEVDAAGYVTEHRYTAGGQRVETIVHTAALAQAVLNQSTVDAIITASGAAAGRERYFYNALNQLKATLSRDNTLTAYSYDTDGNVVQQRVYANQASAPNASDWNFIATASALDVVTTYTYTANKQRETETTAGITTRYTYDKLGKLIETRATAATLQQGQLRRYDEQGNVIAELGAEGAAALAAASPDQVEALWQRYGTRYTYSGNGLRLTAADPLGNKTRYYYNALGNLTHAVNALGEVTATTYTNFGQVASKTMLATRIGAAVLATMNGGQNDAIVSSIEALRNSALDSTQTYEYDGDGRRSATVDGYGNRSLVYYDNFGNVQRVELRNPGATEAADAIPGSRSYYDPNGRLFATVTANGALTAYTYDALDRVTDRITYAREVNTQLSQDQMRALLADPALRDTEHDAHQRFFYDGLTTTTLTAKGVSGSQVVWSVLKTRQDALGNIVERTVYANAVQTANAVPASASYPAVSSADAVTLYAYDGNNRLAATATAQNGTPGATTTSWSIVRNDYNALGNVIATVAYAKALTSVRPTAADISTYNDVSDGDAATYYTYDTAQRISTVATAQNKAGGIVQWAMSSRRYDAAGNLSETIAHATAQTTASVRNYPAAVPVLDPANDRVTSFRYDAANRLQVTIDATGAITRLDYDARGNISQRTSYAVATSARDQITAAYNPALAAADRVVRSVYDRDNRLSFTIDGLGQVSEQRYDAYGNVSATVQYAMPLTAQQIAALGAPAASPAGVVTSTPGVDRVTRHLYSRAGMLRFTIDAAGYVKENVYNILLQLVETREYLAKAPVFADPVIKATVVEEANRQLAAKSASVVVYTYDGMGNRVSTTDALGKTETYAYNARGLKTSFTNKAGDTWTYAYDAAGHLIQENTPAVDYYDADFGMAMGAWRSKGQQSLITKLEYDMLGNLMSRTEASGTSLARTIRYTYDLAGRQTQTILPSLNIYDESIDSKTSVGLTIPFEKRSGERITTVSYNSFGEAVSNRDAAGNISYKIYDRGGQVRYEVDAMAYVTGYERNSFGDVTALTRYNLPALAGTPAPGQLGAAAFQARVRTDAANDRTIRNDYDVLGRLTKTRAPTVSVFDQGALGGNAYINAAKTTETAYDRFGQVRSVFTYGADQQGNRVTAGEKLLSFYDQRGNRTAQVSALSTSAGGNIGRGYATIFQYDWDGSNRIVTQTEYSTETDWNESLVNGGVTLAASAQNRTTSSAYDLANQLVRERKIGVTFLRADQQVTGNVDTTYTYDVLGNQTGVLDAVGSYLTTTYDKLGRVVGLSKSQLTNPDNLATAAQPTSRFMLDLFGNVVIRVDYATALAANADTQAKDVYERNVDNRVTMSMFDIDGRAFLIQDAEQFGRGAASAPTRTSYDVLGRAVKQWSNLLSDGNFQNRFQIVRFDALGRVIEVETPPNADLVDNTTQRNIRKTTDYNAFGEVTSTYVFDNNGVRYQVGHTKYDQAGRAWFTDATDGIDTVTLYDAVGRATAQIRSTGTNLQELDGLANADAARSVAQQLRTDTRYDGMGRITGSSLVGTPTPPVMTRDRWGNVLSITDARDPNWKISYTYNHDNKQLSQTVNALAGSSNVPASAIGYDALGRQVSTTDFNGNRTRYAYDANGNVVAELRPDGGETITTFNLFGNRTSVKQLVSRENGVAVYGALTSYTYDHLSHVTSVSVSSSTAGQLIDVYTATFFDVGDNDKAVLSRIERLTTKYLYDELGRNIAIISPDDAVATLTYDLSGNVIKSVASFKSHGIKYTPDNQRLIPDVAKNITLNRYDAFHNLIGTRDGNGNTMTWTADAFGRVTSHKDLGGGVVTTDYNAAGQRIAQTTKRAFLIGVESVKISYAYDGVLLKTIDQGPRIYEANGNRSIGVDGLTTTYQYDQIGNRTREVQSYMAGNVNAPARVQDNILVYDMQNRVASVKDSVYTLTYSYDNNGNRTSVKTVSATAGDLGTAYNTYDAVNRQLMVNGRSANGGVTVVLGAGSHTLTYDLAGNRMSDTFIGKQLSYSYDTDRYSLTDNALTTETYRYDAIGRMNLTQRDGWAIDERRYDAAGRITESGQVGYVQSGGRTWDRTQTMRTTFRALGVDEGMTSYHYDNNGRVQRQTARDTDGGIKVDYFYVNDPDLEYRGLTGGYDAVGNLLGYTLVTPGTARKDFGRYALTYRAFDSYRESSNRVDRGETSSSTYDVLGNRTAITRANRLIGKYWYDAAGHVQSKISWDDRGVSKASFSMIINDQVLGYEDNDANNILGSTYLSASSTTYTSAPSAYSVQRTGETLQSIASAVWGDAKLWFLIADANGIDASEQLQVGRILNIPTRVNTVHNDASTYRPYDAAEAIGNTTPALPPPSSGGGCGAMGQIVMLVVAVVVTYVTAGAAANAMFAAYGSTAAAAGTTAAAAATAGIAGGAVSVAAGAVVGAAVGSIASQVVGIAIGAQDKFSWKQVAQAGIAGGITAGVTQLGAFNQLPSGLTGQDWSAVAARAALSNTVSQGIGMVTGLQKSFNWAGVAASYAGAAVGSEVNKYLEANSIFGEVANTSARLATATTSGFTAGLAAAVARGGKIAVNQIATDAFGNALGNSLADAINSDGRTLPRRVDREFTSIGPVDLSGPQVNVGGLLAGLPAIATEASNFANALKEFEPSFLDRNASALEAQQIAAGNAARFAGVAGSYSRFGKDYTDYLINNTPAAPTVTYTPPLLLNQFGALDTRPPVGQQLVPWDGVIRESAATSYLRSSGAYAANAGTIEAQVGPVMQPFLLAAVPGGQFALAAQGGYQMGQGYGQYQNGDTTAGALNMLDGALAAAGVGASMYSKNISAVINSSSSIGVSRVLQIKTTAEVNEAMIQSGNLAAWGGKFVLTEIAPVGTRYNMVVSEGQARALMAGQPKFGGWATTDNIPSQNFARNNLAILPEFKPDVSFAVQVVTTAPQTINRGVVGALGNFAGGASQVEFIGARNLKLLGQPQPLPLGH